jgi:hypothetical protein
VTWEGGRGITDFIFLVDTRPIIFRRTRGFAVENQRDRVRVRTIRLGV